MIDQKTTLSKLILSLFRGRGDYVAVGDEQGFHPHKLDKSPLPLAWFEERHLAGKRCLGFYILDEESRCLCSCVDFDNKPDNPDPEWKTKVETVAIWLQNIGLTPLVELSQSGNGAHVWLFTDEPAEASIVRAFWKIVEKKTEVAFKEIFPKQDWLTGKGLGNLVRYPLWARSCFVAADNEFEQLESEAALRDIKKTSVAELREMASKLGEEIKERPAYNAEQIDGLSDRVRDRITKPNSLLNRRWKGDLTGLKDQSRSSLLESIACDLVRQFVPTPEIEAAIRYWCEANDYAKGLRAGWVALTVKKAYDFIFSRMEEKSATALTIQDACHAYITTLEKSERTHITSGIKPLDDSIQGVAFGEMAVIAARPSQGKSALTLQWLDNAIKEQIHCLLISEEMSALELGKRALQGLTPLVNRDWSAHTANALRLDVETHYAGKPPCFLVENCNTVDRVEDVVEQFVKIHGVRMVAVDYVQLLGGKMQKRYDEVTDISRRLKQLAKRLDIALLAVCQLNREIDKRPDHAPKMSDLKESGQLEQDADLILFLQWPRVFSPEGTVDADAFHIYCAKRRNGAIKKQKIETRFNPSRQLIGDEMFWRPEDDE